MRSGEGTLVHVYGVLPAPENASQDPVLPATGIGGSAVGLVRSGSLVALVSELAEEEFGPAVWSAHADDPRWLGEVAAAHHAVLQEVAERTDVLPLRLPGLHRHRDEVVRALTEDEAKLRAALDRISGHVEWGAKVYAGEEVRAEEDAPARSGRDYLARKAAAARRREDRARARDHLVTEAHGLLAAAASRAVVNAPQAPELSGRSEPMLLNGAYLVSRSAGPEFLDLAVGLGDRLYEDGLLLEVSGPWPAYNFTATASAEQAR